MKRKIKKKTILLSISLIICLVVLGSVSFIIISRSLKLESPPAHSTPGNKTESMDNDAWKEMKENDKNKKDTNNIKASLKSDNDFFKSASDSVDLYEKKQHKGNKKKAIIYTVVEEQPGFPGGENARIKFLQGNIRYPEQAKDLGIQGRVFITFVVEVDGSISEVRVVRGIGGGCDEEAIRVIKLMPKWNPGKAKGIPVRVQFNLPIKFTLE